ncbi:hypothetical protein JCM3765_007771 [Sporobolomyces pararoseus]
MTELGQANDLTGRPIRHFEIPAVPMNGCLDMANPLHMWLACDASTNKPYFPTFIFKTLPGPGLAAILAQDEKPLLSEHDRAGMLAFQASNCSITVSDDIDIGDNTLYRHELTLQQVNAILALTTLYPYPPVEVKYEGQYRMSRVRGSGLVQRGAYRLECLLLDLHSCFTPSLGAKPRGSY